MTFGKKLNNLRLFTVFVSLGSMSLLTGCTDSKKGVELVPTSFQKLPGWNKDTHADAVPALNHTCSVIEKKPDSAKMITRRDGQGHAADWKPVCRKFKAARFQNHEEVRDFMETHLMPFQVAADGGTVGTFTGYYIPILMGSRTRHGPYQTPLYRIPGKGVNHKQPRSKIVQGALKGKKLEIVWVDDAIDAFFVQIQGSGQVLLDTGEQLRINISGQNDHPYFPIGKALLDRGELPQGGVSMQSIKKWLQDHPRQAEEIMSLNKSYVYFKESPWTGDIVGSHSVPLTPHRSLAVDRNHISLGTPLWLAAPHPASNKPPLQQLMVAQDTGGAIKGAIRGDYYWGVGDQAAEHAGRMNSKGELFLLLPKH
jgi:membrane-bound lytic murein transglycosylase A